ncbi:MAG TPA: 50S ribosomal protein L21 [Anaerolineales bacterium]|jgi:large subunit ribosomal protein L21
MRFAIIESGGKQYRAVEGVALEVDRLAVEEGKKIDIERILLMADGDDVMVGAPMVSGIQVKATVLGHIKGPKVISFKYRPKKRIRVKGGHRHQYTRLMVDFIGKPGEERKPEKPAAKKEPAEAKRAPVRKEAEKPVTKKSAAAKAPAKKSSAAAKKPATKKTTKK